MSSQAYFDDLITEASRQLTGDEILLANFAGEDTDFVRFNHGDVRQAGTVTQAMVDLELIEGQRHVQASVRPPMQLFPCPTRQTSIWMMAASVSSTCMVATSSCCLRGRIRRMAALARGRSAS